MLDMKVFKSFLEALRDEAGARVCGSFARGDYDRKQHLSDIDFAISGRTIKGIRPIERAIAVFERFGIPGESCAIGQWSSPRDLVTLPRPVEVMEEVWVDCEPHAPKEVIIASVVFKTYKRPFHRQEQD